MSEVLRMMPGTRKVLKKSVYYYCCCYFYLPHWQTQMEDEPGDDLGYLDEFKFL